MWVHQKRQPLAFINRYLAVRGHRGFHIHQPAACRSPDCGAGKPLLRLFQRIFPFLLIGLQPDHVERRRAAVHVVLTPGAFQITVGNGERALGLLKPAKRQPALLVKPLHFRNLRRQMVAGRALVLFVKVLDGAGVFLIRAGSIAELGFQILDIETDLLSPPLQRCRVVLRQNIAGRDLLSVARFNRQTSRHRRDNGDRSPVADLAVANELFGKGFISTEIGRPGFCCSVAAIRSGDGVCPIASAGAARTTNPTEKLIGMERRLKQKLPR